MKDYVAAILLAYFMATAANLVHSLRNLNNNSNFNAGSCCKKIEEQLTEIKEEIRAEKRCATGW